MNRFLNDGISIEGASQVEKAAYLLRGANVDKASLSNLATKLNNTSMFTNAILASIKKGSIASGVGLANIFSEVYSRLENLFATSNAVSLLMSNTAEILSQEIKKLEEELFSLEKNVNNYGFLLADGNAYDSVFFESFSDQLYQDLIDPSNIRLSDRSGVDFSANEIGFIDKSEGILTLPKNSNREYPLKATVYASNCAAFLSNPISTTSIANTVDYLNSNGWRPVVESPVIIDSSLNAFGNLYGGNAKYSGAQFILEYLMDDESPADTILIEPLSDYSFDLVQVLGFSSDTDQVGEPLMAKSVKIEKTFNLFFPKKSFKKFHLYINQKAYTRVASNRNIVEATAEQRVMTKDELSASFSDTAYEIDTKYPVVDLTSYWQKVLQNLGGSLSRDDFEILSQGLPSYWTHENGLVQNQTGVFEDNDGVFYGRDQQVDKSDVDYSYLQGLMGRFFGNQEGSIGSFFKTIISNYYYQNSPTTVAAIGSTEPELRFAPYPRIGENEADLQSSVIQESDAYTIGVPDATGWNSQVNWDFWNNGVVRDILKKEDSQIIPPSLVWSEKDGKWVTRQSLNIKAGDVGEYRGLPHYGDTQKLEQYMQDVGQVQRVDEPYEPSAGGGTKYTVPSVSYNEVLMRNNNSYSYRYTMGLKFIKVKLSNYAQRAVYISSLIDTMGDVSEVKLKSSATNFIEENTSNSLTSVEYSVTTSFDFTNESSWKPILPIENSLVRGERLFPDSSGLAQFRFNATGEGISLYKNGIQYSYADVSSFYVKRDNTNIVYGLKIPLTKYTSTDILTCDYVPTENNSVISFDNFSNQINSYLSYYNEGLPGQSFEGLNQTQYQLDFIPYIDYNQVETSSYSLYFGLSPYTPISILFDDGSYAINLTNYKNKDRPILDSSDEQYYFLQSGNVIIFNKSVNKNFRVFYNFLPSTFRVRVVLRSNYFESVSPKVDFYQIKAKTRKPDSQRY